LAKLQASRKAEGGSQFAAESHLIAGDGAVLDAAVYPLDVQERTCSERLLDHSGATGQQEERLLSGCCPALDNNRVKVRPLATGQYAFDRCDREYRQWAALQSSSVLRVLKISRWHTDYCGAVTIKT
jgi:hypothetical protein